VAEKTRKKNLTRGRAAFPPPRRWHAGAWTRHDRGALCAPHGGEIESASAGVRVAPHYWRIRLLPALINYSYSRLAEYSSAQNVPP
jgi:hypothetical protein